MTPEEIYEKQTGVPATYPFYVHSVGYVKWLEEQNAKLLEALKAGYPFVKAHVGALHMMDGFNPQEREEDKLVLKIEQAIAEAEGS